MLKFTYEQTQEEENSKNVTHRYIFPVVVRVDLTKNNMTNLLVKTGQQPEEIDIELSFTHDSTKFLSLKELTEKQEEIQTANASLNEVTDQFAFYILQQFA